MYVGIQTDYNKLHVPGIVFFYITCIDLHTLTLSEGNIYILILN